MDPINENEKTCKYCSKDLYDLGLITWNHISTKMTRMIREKQKESVWNKWLMS